MLSDRILPFNMDIIHNPLIVAMDLSYLIPFSVLLSGMLADLGRKKFVSQAALAELLSELKDAPLPEATSRSSIKRARDEKVDITTPCGPLFVKRTLATVNGGCLIKFMG